MDNETDILKRFQQQQLEERLEGLTKNETLIQSFINYCKSKQIKLTKGETYVVSDGLSSHRSVSAHGTKLLVIDGDFLKTNQ